MEFFEVQVNNKFIVRIKAEDKFEAEARILNLYGVETAVAYDADDMSDAEFDFVLESSESVTIAQLEKMCSDYEKAFDEYVERTDDADDETAERMLERIDELKELLQSEL